jgi:hypothetical protein
LKQGICEPLQKDAPIESQPLRKVSWSLRFTLNGERVLLAVSFGMRDLFECGKQTAVT